METDRTASFLDCHVNVENCTDAKTDVKYICTSTSAVTIVQLNSGRRQMLLTLVTKSSSFRTSGTQRVHEISQHMATT